MSKVQTGTVTTKVPARLDRLPWSRWHWMIIIGLGTVWILDGLEVTIVGNISGQLSMPGSGIHITQSQVTGLGAAMYVAGACVGALFFGWLTDRFGRKKLFMITLGIYLAATALTALSFAPWWFFLFRFLTGFGIGGEYAAINSAIDELIPSRHRGMIDIVINGTYWAGAAAGALISVPATSDLPVAVGWRVCFGLGVVLGLVILLVRRNVPESPRWLFIHGRAQQAEDLVDGIERRVEQETGAKLTEPDKSITIRQRKTIGFVTIARTMFAQYPRRTILGFSLFIGQAFLYNAITFGYALILATFFHVKTNPGYYFAFIAVGNLLGPLLLARLFDTIGRKPMIAGHLHPVRPAPAGHGVPVRSGLAERHHDDRVLVRGAVLRLGGRQLGLSHGQRGLPHGNQGAGHRVLLRHRHRRGRHHRAAAVLGPGQHGPGIRHRARLLDRGVLDDPGRPRRDRPGRAGRAAEPGGHRPAADRGRARSGPSASGRLTPGAPF
jgi:MFS family permease